MSASVKFEHDGEDLRITSPPSSPQLGRGLAMLACVLPFPVFWFLARAHHPGHDTPAQMALLGVVMRASCAFILLVPAVACLLSSVIVLTPAALVVHRAVGPLRWQRPMKRGDISNLRLANLPKGGVCLRYELPTGGHILPAVGASRETLVIIWRELVARAPELATIQGTDSLEPTAYQVRRGFRAERTAGGLLLRIPRRPQRWIAMSIPLAFLSAGIGLAWRLSSQPHRASIDVTALFAGLPPAIRLLTLLLLAVGLSYALFAIQLGLSTLLSGLAAECVLVTSQNLQVQHSVGPLVWRRTFDRSAARELRVAPAPPPIQLSRGLTSGEEAVLFRRGKKVSAIGCGLPVVDLALIAQSLLDYAPELGSREEADPVASHVDARSRIEGITRVSEVLRINLAPEGVTRWTAFRVLVLIPSALLGLTYALVSEAATINPRRAMPPLPVTMGVVVFGCALIVWVEVLARFTHDSLIVTREHLQTSWTFWRFSSKNRMDRRAVTHLRAVRVGSAETGLAAIVCEVAGQRRTLLTGLPAADALRIRDAVAEAAPNLAGPAGMQEC